MIGKRMISAVLCLLMLAFLLPARAAGRVMVSRQSLRVDGKTVNCQKYNIDDRNYFMLRDLALLLMGTGSRFSVVWDEVSRCVRVASGEEYVPDGSELDLSLGDRSATAVPSVQPIIIDGVERADLTVYNIGGHNFFQLRELGEALGFFVDYDKPSNTAIVISRPYALPQLWLELEELEVWERPSGEREESRTRSVYNTEGRMLSCVMEAYGTVWTQSWTYDDLGRPLTTTLDSRDTETGEERNWEYQSYEYDLWGNIARSAYVTPNGRTVREYAYDDQANVIREQWEDRTVENTYDGRGNLLRTVTTYADGSTQAAENVWDEGGNLLLHQQLDGEGKVVLSTACAWDEAGNLLLREERNELGEVYASDAYTLENGRVVEEILTAGSRVSVTKKTWDEAGFLAEEVYEVSDGTGGRMTYTRDAAGRILRQEWRSGEEFSSYTYEYDEAGRLLRESYAASGGETAETECAYDGEGYLIWKKTVLNGLEITEKSVSYDRAARKETTLIIHRQAPAERLVFPETELTLEVGQTYRLGFYFEPQGAYAPLLTWSSSDPSVVTAEDFGKLTALAPGEAVVTAEAESGLRASCRVTVK